MGYPPLVAMTKMVVSQKLKTTQLNKTEFGLLEKVQVETKQPYTAVVLELASISGFDCEYYRSESGQKHVVWSPGKWEKPSNASTQMASSPRKSYALTAEEHHKYVDGIKSLLEDTYRVSLSEGKVLAQEIFALAETLSRVPKDKWDTSKENLLRERTPSRLYEWGISNSSVVLPYLSLKVAGEHMKDSQRFAPASTWGLLDGIYHLPKKESVSDSSLWGLIGDIISANYGSDKLLHDALADSTVPNLDSDTVAKHGAINSILIRILELFKNPNSVTIRGGSDQSLDKQIRNAVDFYVMDRYRMSNKGDYSSLSYIPYTAQLRRLVATAVPQPPGSKAKVVESKRRVGYLVAQLLTQYLDQYQSPENPESETFCRFIFSILDSIVRKLELDKSFSLPKSLFLDQASILRVKIRKGPDISKGKKIVKNNLYIPFSFTKSSECEAMPEVIKKELTSIGAGVLECINSMNKISLLRQNGVTPFFEEYISIAYSHSDEIRKQWRLNARVSQPRSLHYLVDRFPTSFELEDDTSSKSEAFLSHCKTITLDFSDACTNKSDQVALKERLSQEHYKKISARKRGRV